MRTLRSSILILFCLMATACAKVPLVQELEQGDANEILVLLGQNGITAKKVAVKEQQETTWMIEVPKSDEGRAQQLLVENDLPKKRAPGLSEVCKDDVMIPTPKMEKCREMLAMKGEIINSLESIPGVIKADVVLNVPDKQDFPDPNVATPRPTASVTIQMGSLDNGHVLTEEKVQQFVANSVTGMDLRDVAVIISRYNNLAIVNSGEGPTTEVALVASPADDNGGGDPSDLVSVGGLNMSADSANKFKALTVVFLAIFVVLSAALIGILLKLSKVRQEAGLVSGSKVALPEKVSMNQLVEETRKAEEMQ